MPNKRAAIAGAVAGLIVLAGVALYLSGGGGRGCSSREDVTARVAEVSSQLQQVAAQGKMTVEHLADGVKKLNAAATAYETTQDHQAYCESLDTLNAEFAPDA